MRQTHIIAAALLPLLLLAVPGTWAEKTPRLFFKKEIQSPTSDEKTYTHQVREGEWLYEILRSHGFSDQEIPVLLKAISRLNPHIRDLDSIQPGQTIHIPPLKPITRPETAASPPRQAPLRYTARPYVIRSGDTAVAILRQQANVPEHLIFNEYLNLLRSINPGIRDIDTIAAGQRIQVPVPAGQEAVPVTADPEGVPAPDPGTDPGISPLPRSFLTAANEPAPAGAPDPGPEPEPEPDPEPENEKLGTESNATLNRSLTMAMLERMGVNFVTGTESMLPVPNGGWYRLNVQQTPLGTTSWGERVLLVPARNRLDDFPDSLLEEITVCELPDDWAPRAVLSRLETATDKKMSLWPRERPLIVQRRGYMVELQSDYIMVVDSLPRKTIYLFNRLDKGDRPLPSLVRGFLSRLSIQVEEWRIKGSGQPEPTTLSWPAMSSLLTPLIPAHDAWPDIKNLLGSLAEGLEPGSANVVTVMSELQSAGLALPRQVRFPFVRESRRGVHVSSPVMELKTPDGAVYIFDSRHADPYLLALLSLEGRQCYGISDHRP